MVKKRRRRKWVLLVAVLGVLLAVWSLRPRPGQTVVRVATVERLDELKALVNASGEIQARDSVDIQAEIAGVIIDLPVEEGMSVQKGQILLKIDPFQSLSDVESSKASLSALEAEAKGQEFQIATAEANAARDRFLRDSARVELRQAETNLARTRVLQARERKLLEADLISPDQFELTDTQLKLDQARVEAAQAKVQQYESQLEATKSGIEYARAALQAIKERSEAARSNLRRAEDLLSKTTIRSPLDGVVVSLNVEVGERAVPGIQSNPIATLMTISDLRVIEAELQVDETDIVNVKLDDVGEVTVDALPDKPLVGTVIEIGNSPIAGSGSQEGKDFKVVLNIAEPPQSLRPGMSCEADITTDVRQDVLVVPIQALTAREVDVDGEGRYVPPPAPEGTVVGKVAAAEDRSDLRREELEGVFVVGEDGLAHFRPVETGILGEIDVEILEGVVEGEEVVVGPLEALRTLLENTPVTVDRSKPFLRLGRHSLQESEASGDRR